MVLARYPNTGWRAIFRGVRARLLGSYIILVFVLLVGLAAAFSTEQVLRSHFTHTVNTVDALTTTVVQTSKLIDDEETSLRGYLLTGDRDFLQPYVAAEHTLPALNARAESLLAGDAHGYTLLAAMRGDAHAWQGWAAPYLRQLPNQAGPSPAFVASMLGGKVLFDRFRQSSNHLALYLDAERARDLQDGLKANQQTGGIFFWVLICSIGLVLTVGWLTTRGITRSLNQLVGAAIQIGRGDLAQPIVVSGAYELTRLGGTMDQMRRQLYAQRALAEILGSSLHLDSLCSQFALGARDLAPFDRLSLIALDSDGIMMTTRYAEGVSSSQFGAGTRRPLQSISTSLLQPGQRCLILPDLTTLPPEPRFDDVQIGLRDGMRSKAIVPLWAKGRMVGSLNLGSKQLGAYTEELLGPILALAPLVGAALENAHLYASLDEANAALARANRELETFAYSVSHDLRAPLRSIAGFSQALVEDYADTLGAEGKGYLTLVIEASRNMGQLIDDLLRLSRVTRADLQCRQTDMTTLARDLVEELARREPAREVSVVIAEELVVSADERLLRVALENLLGNAWKFTRHTPDARIELGTTIYAGRQAFFVRDNGAGFDMAYVQKLFGAFQRLHSAQEFEGTGIGLATVQRIIQRHGGQVWAEGAVGQGASIYFTLERTEGVLT